VKTESCGTPSDYTDNGLIGGVATVADGTQARSYRRIYNEARLIAILRARGSGDQLHGLKCIGWNLRGEDLILLVADGLTINHVARLCVISQRMEKAVGVRGDTAAYWRKSPD
jgi:hypothetical protein